MSAADHSFNMGYQRRIDAARQYGYNHFMVGHAPQTSRTGGLANIHYQVANRIRRRFPFLSTYGHQSRTLI